MAAVRAALDVELRFAALMLSIGFLYSDVGVTLGNGIAQREAKVMPALAWHQRVLGPTSLCIELIDAHMNAQRAPEEFNAEAPSKSLNTATAGRCFSPVR